jgi:hypothetical protein
MSGKIVYQCTRCEKVHEGLPAMTFDAPYYYYLLTEAERAARAVLTDDFCVVDGEDYFVRTVLEIPILGYADRLHWGVWSSLSRDNFGRYRDAFDDHDQSKLEPIFSWLASSLPDYPETLNIRSRIVPCDGRMRPQVELAPDESHPLALDQRNGISLERAIELVSPLLHED